MVNGVFVGWFCCLGDEHHFMKMRSSVSFIL